MDRFTKRGFDPELEFCAECDYHGEPNGCNRACGDCSAYTVFTEAYTRLAAYEDTGLTPDEIAALKRWQEPSRVLTLEEVRDRGGCPVWCEDRDGSGAWALVIAWDDKCIDADFGDWEFYCYGWTNERGWRAWTKKPSKRALAANPWPKED